MRQRIAEASLDDPTVVRMLATHYRAMRSTGPIESCHVLSIDEMRGRDLTLWGVWSDPAPTPGDAPQLLALGAIQDLGRQHGEIKSMHTAQDARGRGIGAALLAHMLVEARSRCFARLSLETGAGEDFAAARRLYERHDFVECTPFGNYRPDPHSVFMTRIL